MEKISKIRFTKKNIKKNIKKGETFENRTEQSRSGIIDICRGIAILLVVFGHNIQYGSGTEFFGSADYFMHPVFKFIYSFHMPMFALISGFLCHIKTNDSIKSFTSRKMKSLFIPILSWVTIEFFLKAVVQFYDSSSMIQLFKTFLNTLFYSYWFLWAMFFCAIAIWMYEKLLRGNTIVVVIAVILSMCIPSRLNSHMYIFVFPYYLLGYIWQKRMKSFKLSVKWFKVLFPVVMILYGLLLLGYNYDTYIYTTQIYLFGSSGWIHQIGINLYRWIIGLCGSCFIILAIYFIENKLNIVVKKMLIKLGKNTLGIYIISTFFNMYVYKIIYRFAGQYFFPNAVIWIVETVVILMFCLGICGTIKKSKIANKLLLGGR